MGLLAITVLPFALGGAGPRPQLSIGYGKPVSLRSDIEPMRGHFPIGTSPATLTAMQSRCASKSPSKLNQSLGFLTLTVEWVPVTIEDQFQAVQENKVDLLCGAAETLTSRKDVDFSIPIFPGGIGALLRANAPVGLKEVLSGQPPSGPLVAWFSCTNPREASFLGGRGHT